MLKMWITYLYSILYYIIQLYYIILYYYYKYYIINKIKYSFYFLFIYEKWNWCIPRFTAHLKQGAKNNSKNLR